MNQQPHQQPQEAFYGYQSSVNRSPSSSRSGYATTVGIPGPLGARSGQRPLDPIGQPPSLYADDRSFSSSNSYDPSRFERISTPSSSLHGNYMLGNNQAWGFNASNANTVNGAVFDGSRMRGGNRRGLPTVRHAARPIYQIQAWPFANAALPQEWTTSNDPALFGQPVHGQPGGYGPMAGQHYGAMNGSDHSGLGTMGGGLFSNMRRYEEEQKKENDLIPTAIVIKNIPFNIRKEALTSLMVEMNLPQPYAFNYHFDGGIFRGLAFANFQSPADTAAVIEHMNGLEVGGRKLRVEYKKMLPEAERERIEREKREKRGQLEEQHRAMPLNSHASMQSLNHSLTTPDQPSRDPRARELPPPPSPPADADAFVEIDLNNPETLGFYTQLTLFRNDPSKEVLVFPPGTNPDQRRQIHVLAHNMGLQHSSTGQGEKRQLQVFKMDPSQQLPFSAAPPGVSLEAHRRGLSRAATIDFAETRAGSSSNYHTIGRGHGPTLEVPDGSPDGGINSINSLRGVKSFADLRSYTPSPSPSTGSFVNLGGTPAPNGLNSASVARYGDYPTGLTQTNSLTTPTTPSSGADAGMLVAGMGSISLQGGFDVGTGSGNCHSVRPREGPGAIGSQRPSMKDLNNRANAPERQPRGPAENWETGGFGNRGRPNGHMQRGSGRSSHS